MEKLYRKLVTIGKRLAMSALKVMMACGVLAMQVQANAATVKKEFTACALNIDGLPQTMAGITVNADGPGSEGTQAIGKYLVDKGIDMVGISEDFNYHGDLIMGLGENYQMGTWRGRIDASGIFDGLHFNTDGLMFLLKHQNSNHQTMSFDNESWTKWNESLGGLADGANTLVDKGYRFYTVNLGDNVRVDVYVLHMNTAENAEQIAVQDNQLTQLAEAIKSSSDGRPTLILGDTNCRYTRNKLEENLITPLSATYDIRDAWVERFRDGQYPTYGSDALMVMDKTSSKAYETGEIVDKIFYLTPKGCSLNLTLKDLVFDADNYKNVDGTLLGDHVPVIATFEIAGTLAAENLTPATQAAFWEGETLESVASVDEAKAYIINVGSQTFVTDNTPSEKDIDHAVKWRVTPGNSTYTFYRVDSDNKPWRIKMNSSNVGVLQSNSGATDFKVVSSSTTSGAYKFDAEYFTLAGKSNHHFNVDGSKYTGANNSSVSVYNDWLFISEAQKTAYHAYQAAYEAAKELLGKEDYKDYFEKEPDMKAELEQVLLETTHTVYSTSAANTGRLSDVADRIKNHKGNDATGVDPIEAADEAATVTAVYGNDGERRARLERGVNIVRMSDGTTRKLIVK